MTTTPPPTAQTREEILACLQNTPLRIGQIDVNGKCNAKCWYCPVKYEGNPQEFAVQMPPEMLDEILGKLRASPLITPDFRFLYTCHYNEVLLYRHFAELPGLFRKHGFATMVLSNGTPLTPEKIDIIMDNQDVIWGLALNIPALEQNDWARKTGFPASMHNKLLRNLDYLHERRSATIQINCATNTASVLGEGMGNTSEEAENIAEAFRQRYPKFKISLQTWLSDRAGKLSEHGAISLQQAARQPIIGCSHSANEGGRVFGWAHINARGQMFLCCDDYEMRYRFGDLTQQSFAEAWLSAEHIDAIEASRNGICRHCPFRIEQTA